MRKLWLIFSQAVTVAVAVIFVVSTLKPQWIQSLPWQNGSPVVTLPLGDPPPATIPGAGQKGVRAADVGFSDAAKRAAPTVVSVITSKACSLPNAISACACVSVSASAQMLRRPVSGTSMAVQRKPASSTARLSLFASDCGSSKAMADWVARFWVSCGTPRTSTMASSTGKSTCSLRRQRTAPAHSSRGRRRFYHLD